MKRFRLGFVSVLAVGVAVMGAPPAKASVTGPEHLLTPIMFTSSYELGFVASSCNPLVASPLNPLNGSDAAIFDVSSVAGGVFPLTWTRLVGLNTLVGGGLVARFYTASCLAIAPPVGTFAPGTWNIGVPAGATWMVVTAHYVADVHFLW